MLKQIQLFEVDHPATQNCKLHHLQELKWDIATEEEMKRWNNDLNRKTEEHEFFGMVNMILVSGRNYSTFTFSSGS